MKITALRSIAKINSNVIQNSCRPFSFKFEMTPAGRAAENEEVKAEENVASNFRYNVYQPRTSPVEKASTGDSHKTSIQAAIEQQHLQPSMLPEYYQKQMEKNALVNPEPEATEEIRINTTANQRKFQVSKTYANAILPLKSVKLANPFPEPVKMMMSRTVSDEEKAEQMLADARSQKNYANSNNTSQFRNFSTEVRRWYSKTVGKNPEKCKKVGQKKGACPKMSLKGCPPRARTKCDRHSKQKKCTKQEAPYPAYSEFCHEELDEKPSECKLCPWKMEEHPHFKPQKKKFHTSTFPMEVKRSGLEMEFGKEIMTGPIAEQLEEMQCDLRKPQCERPKNRRCPPTKEEKKKEEKKKKPKEQKCQTSELQLDELLPAQETQSVYSLKGKKPGRSHGKCKIRKFKFPTCEAPTKREGNTDRCPKKKRKAKIYDCPPDHKDCERFVEGVTIGGMSLAEEEDKTRKNCPDVDMTVDPDQLNKCKKKKSDGTKNCPGDLLKKKRRPKKKTSGVLTPTGSNSNIQPTKSI